MSADGTLPPLRARSVGTIGFPTAPTRCQPCCEPSSLPRSPLFPARAADPDAKEIEFFEKKIRPVLVEQCYKCHSAEAEKDKKLKGGFKLDTKASLLKGGDSGLALVAGKPDEGTLLKSLHYTDDELQMPPKGKLPDAVVKDFERWIADGAADPRTDTTAKSGADHRHREGQAVLVVRSAARTGCTEKPKYEIRNTKSNRRLRGREVGREGVDAGRGGRQADADSPRHLRPHRPAADARGDRRLS